ncbi:heme-dependent oxidative N-demethylase family protein [Acidisoma silvae]|nr:DUF3445 domain-containing protein [Acidisoma silvae]
MRDDVLPPAPLYLPYEAGEQRMVMGLGAVQEPDWLEWDSRAPLQIAERQRLLAERRAEVLADTPGSEAACAELRDVLAGHLEAHRPGWKRPDWDADEHPLASVCPWAVEDFCLMKPGPEGAVLIAAILCFPSRWRLADKIGKPMIAIHVPVPGYKEALGKPVDRFLASIKAGRLASRFNWSIMDDATLFQPKGHGLAGHNAAITAANAGEMLWLRVERQTFRLLPESGVVAFGIGMHVTPLAQVVEIAGEAGKLASAVRGLPPEMERYKSLLPYRAALLDYLDGKALSLA